MTTFDGTKAIREEIAGLSDILRTLRQQERGAEEAMSKAESELNNIRKLRGFAEITMVAKRGVLERLVQEAEKAGGR